MPVFGKGEEIYLDGVVALVDGFHGSGRVVIHGDGGNLSVVPAELKLGGVASQAVAHFAAQKLVHGHVEVFALDVPQGDVERGDGGKDHGAAVLSPEGGFVELFPDDLVVQRIHAENAFGKVLEHAEGGSVRVAVGQGGLAVAVETGIGVDAAEYGRPAGIVRRMHVHENDVDLAYFHDD